MKRRREDVTDEDPVKRQSTFTRPQLIMEAHCAQLDFNRAFKQPYDNYELLEYVISLNDPTVMWKFIDEVRKHAVTGTYASLEELQKSL